MKEMNLIIVSIFIIQKSLTIPHFYILIILMIKNNSIMKNNNIFFYFKDFINDISKDITQTSAEIEKLIDLMPRITCNEDKQVKITFIPLLYIYYINIFFFFFFF